MASLPRLFVDAPLSADAPPALTREQVHYVLNVMRRRAGDEVLLFNGRDGEWRAGIAAASKREVRLDLVLQTRAQEAEPGPTLWFAPLKRARQELLLEKATELGVGRVRPVLMRRSVVEKVNLARQKAILVEAAEQSGRLTVPDLDPPVGLDAVLAAASKHPILWADEAAAHPPSAPAPGGPLTPSLSPRGRGGCSSPGRTSAPLSLPDRESDDGAELVQGRDRPPLLSRERAGRGPDPVRRVRGVPVPLVEALGEHPDADLLIGPEGGFDPAERAMLRRAPGVVPVSLGPRILRAETAALAALAGWQLARPS